MRFDFHRKVIINEITWYKDGFAGAQGIFQPQLSNDGVTWTNCGTTIDFFGSSAPFVITALSANTIPARYYRLLGVSGNSVITVQYEIEFKIGNPL